MKRIVTDLNKLNDRVDEAILQDEAKVTETIENIKEILYKKKDIVALSAPQIGVKARIFCIKFANGDIRTFINPFMTAHTKNLHLSRETSASIPDKEFIVPRIDEVQAVYQTPVGKIENNLFTGVVAEIFQQMVQSLDGIMLSDIGLEVLEGFDEADEETKNKIIDMYLDSLKSTETSLNEEIKNNDSLKAVSDAIDFMTSVAEGKTILEQPKQEIQHLNRVARKSLAKLTKTPFKEINKKLGM